MPLLSGQVGSLCGDDCRSCDQNATACNSDPSCQFVPDFEQCQLNEGPIIATCGETLRGIFQGFPIDFIFNLSSNAPTVIFSACLSEFDTKLILKDLKIQFRY